MKSRLVFALLFLCPMNASANGWSLLSQHQQMTGFVIAEVGEVSKVEPPLDTTWNEDVYKMNGRCFFISSYMGYWGYGSKSALLLVYSAKLIKLAIIKDELGLVNVELKDIRMINCPY